MGPPWPQHPSGCALRAAVDARWEADKQRHASGAVCLAAVRALYLMVAGAVPGYWCSTAWITVARAAE